MRSIVDMLLEDDVDSAKSWFMDMPLDVDSVLKEYGYRLNTDEAVGWYRYYKLGRPVGRVGQFLIHLVVYERPESYSTVTTSFQFTGPAPDGFDMGTIIGWPFGISEIVARDPVAVLVNLHQTLSHIAQNPPGNASSLRHLIINVMLQIQKNHRG